MLWPGPSSCRRRGSRSRSRSDTPAGSRCLEPRSAGRPGTGRLQRRPRSSRGGGDEVARFVLQLGRRNVVRESVGEFDVTDAARLLFDDRGHAVVALGAYSCQPLDALARTDFRLPVGTYKRQVAREVEGRSGGVGAVHHLDVGVRKRDALVESRDVRIVPLGDRAREDSRQGIGVKLQRVNPWQVVGDGDGAEDTGDVERLCSTSLLSRR